MREIIRQFDVNMSHKANKSYVNQALADLPQAFILKADLEVFNTRFDEVLDKIESNSEAQLARFDQMRRD